MHLPARRQSASLFHARIGRQFLLSAALSIFGASQVMAQNYVPVPLTQWDGQQATIVVTNIDINPRPDLFVLSADKTDNANRIRYSIGWNLGANGAAQKWDADPNVIPGPTGDMKGMGAALVNITGDSRPELVLVTLVAENGKLSARYTIGRSLNKTGKAQSWDPEFKTAIEDAGNATAVDVVATNLDDDDYTDLIVLLFDASTPEHTLRYKIGWNMGDDPAYLQWSPDFIEVKGIGNFSRGARARLINLDGDARPELLVMSVDPATGSFTYAVGWNIGDDGRAERWEKTGTPIPGIGAGGLLAGIGVTNLNADPKPDLIVMAYDAGPKGGKFSYRLVPDVGTPPTIDLQMNKFDSVAWPPASIKRDGETVTLSSIYSRIGIALNVRQNDPAIPDPKNGACYTDSDLDALLRAIQQKYPEAGATAQNAWLTRALFIKCYSAGTVYGIMFNTLERRAFAVFMDVIDEQAKVMRTTAHELGHSLCLYHDDGDAEINQDQPVAGTGFSVMNQTWALAQKWGYGWNTAELHKIYERSMRRWRAGSEYPFGKCH